MRIDGKNIILRDWQVRDLAEYELWRQPGQVWEKFNGPYYSKPSAAEVAKLIAELREKIRCGQFAEPREELVIAESSTDRLIGRVSWYWQGKETNWLSVGIAVFNPDCWGRGIGYEALGLWSEYLFRAMPVLARLDLRTWSGNKGMMRLAEKLGYTQEACFRKARIVNGEYYDSIGYGVLREEWDAVYPDGFIAALSDKSGDRKK